MNRGFWPKIGVGAVVVRDGEVLLVKRKYPPFQGYWSIPGGHLKPGETIVEGGLRELEEETGITGKPLGILDIHELIMFSNSGVERHYLLIDILVEYVEGEVRAASDALEAKWFTLREALEEKLTPSTRKLLEKLYREGLDRIVLAKTTITKCRGESFCD